MTGLSDTSVAEMAAALCAARRSGIPIEPLTDAHPAMSVHDAYRVQQNLLARLLADGDRIAGYKLGLTSTPIQRMFGLDSPDFAPVLASHVHPDGAGVAAGGFIHPRAEAEQAGGRHRRLRLAGMVFTRDGDVVATGAGAAALGGPLQAAAGRPGRWPAW